MCPVPHRPACAVRCTAAVIAWCLQARAKGGGEYGHDDIAPRPAYAPMAGVEALGLTKQRRDDDDDEDDEDEEDEEDEDHEEGQA